MRLLKLLILIFFFTKIILAQNKCELLAGNSVEFSKIDENKSISACKNAVKDNPNNIKYWHMLGRSFDKALQNKQALLWYRKAALKGYKMSQYNLGLKYEFGEGVDIDVVEAINGI